MLAIVYEYTRDVSRSVLGATAVAEIEVDEVPVDQDAFAAEHGGHFIELVSDPALAW